ncbi:lytic transglycosylase domain-containing protein [Leeuwenhoekiella polynyae]|uniref:Transglycosylase-like protein with SLT domain n=1 Tax=Leeuwenhoekiella polynyae TaxID=1550906 RepID=A0A4Q0PFS0_9FLAO|nr:lytic transglycosylase domain-containing protein [Leeuwenhoekiella polynyae]RXG25703.1 transglycosylase-like protein with SLT domain [Leeuwenhoekiella polynyae]
MASPLDPEYKAIRNKIDYYGKKYGVDPKIGYWQLWQESRFKQYAKSPVGAAGIAQFMPATAKEWNVDVNDIDSSIDGWARYMAWILKRSYVGGKYDLALAAYNAGVGNVQKYGAVPPFEETQNYVKTILKNRGSLVGLSVGTFVALGFAAYFLTKAFKTF